MGPVSRCAPGEAVFVAGWGRYPMQEDGAESRQFWEEKQEWRQRGLADAAGKAVSR